MLPRSCSLHAFWHSAALLQVPLPTRGRPPQKSAHMQRVRAPQSSLSWARVSLRQVASAGRFEHFGTHSESAAPHRSASTAHSVSQALIGVAAVVDGGVAAEAEVDAVC